MKVEGQSTIAATALLAHDPLPDRGHSNVDDVEARDIAQMVPGRRKSVLPRVTDNLPDIIPISTKELAAVEMFLGSVIDALVKSAR